MQESLSKTSSKRAVDLEFVDEEDLILRENTWVRHQIQVLIVQSCYTKQQERGEEAASCWKYISTVKLLDTLINDSDDSKLL